jgi:thymidylate kinase
MSAQAARMAAAAEPTTPTTPTAKVKTPVLCGLVAVVGCDGTGKSTITHDLVKHLRAFGPVERRYLGLISGEQGAKIKELPIIGPRLERRLAAKADKAQDTKNKLPGVFGSLIMYGFSLWRARHLKRVWRLANSGVLVISDRYPQAEVTGFRYDGPGLGVNRSKNWLVRKLAVREQRLYERMAQYKPTLIIRLDIDLATAYARKPDHSVAELNDKIAIMSKLQYNDSTIVDLDSRAPYTDVLARAMSAIRGSATAGESQT